MEAALNAYFDESGTHTDSPALCVAGYVFDADEAAQFERECQWLRGEFGLTHFHMADCAHGTGPFQHLSAGERNEAARRLIGIIRRRAAAGFAASVVEAEFEAILDSAERRQGLSAYTVCAHACLLLLQHWADSRGVDGQITYFFEAGHARQGELGAYLGRVVGDPAHAAWKHRFRMGAFTFVAKGCGAIDAADLLAWQFFTERRRRAEGKGSRMDFLSLTEGMPHFCRHLDSRRLRELELKLQP